jgi:uncharacterized protein YggT (Ycf19 family)
MKRDTSEARDRAQDRWETPERKNGRDDVRYGAEAGTARETEASGDPVPRQIEPNRVDVERRAKVERRVVDQPVEEDRRIADRRAVIREEQERQTLEARERRSYVVARATQAVDYLFYLLYGLLGIRFVLSLLGASEQAGFVQLVHGITQPFYGPFAGIVSRPAVNGGFIDFPLLIALLAYALLHMAIRGLLRLIAGSRPVA